MVARACFPVFLPVFPVAFLLSSSVGSGGLKVHEYVWSGKLTASKIDLLTGELTCFYHQFCANDTTPSCPPSVFTIDISLSLTCPKYMVEEGLYTVGGGGKKHCLAGIAIGAEDPADCK